jgi:hypothetical protein
MESISNLNADVLRSIALQLDVPGFIGFGLSCQRFQILCSNEKFTLEYIQAHKDELTLCYCLNYLEAIDEDIRLKNHNCKQYQWVFEFFYKTFIHFGKTNSKYFSNHPYMKLEYLFEKNKTKKTTAN